MRNIPEDNLAYSVLIRLDTGSAGSGFFLSSEHDDLFYLVTAKHVLYDEQNKLRGNFLELTAQPRDIKEQALTILKVDLKVIPPLPHPTSDIAVIKIGQRKKEGEIYNLYYLNGVQQIQGAKSGTVSAASERVKLLKDVLVSNDIFLQGYPSSLGLKQSPQFDYNKPLLRKGIVANINPNQGTIILDCPVYFGNSGGPVVEVEQIGNEIRYSLIGVISQFIPFVQEWVNPPTRIVNTEFHNSGYSVAVSMDKVLELTNPK